MNGSLTGTTSTAGTAAFPTTTITMSPTTSLSFSDANKGIGFSGPAGSYFANSFPSNGIAVYGYSDGCLGTTNGNTRQTTLSWLANGNVGIGTISPGYPLDVLGDIRLSGNIRSTGARAINYLVDWQHNFITAGVLGVVINGSSVQPGTDNASSCGINVGRWTAVYSVTGVIQTSDENEKDSVPLAYGIDDVMKISTIKYKWKSQADLPDTDPAKQYEYYGCCARELHSLFPELIYTDQVEGQDPVPYQLNYSELVPILINAIKDLKKEINEMKGIV